ncbi:styrene monooxygenase/indole monooxygenase family protein [Streptomyces alboflavus]|uniref:styrene monooxygenase/indole monooxygenase family protein n=1 Tax=Streptomyces alboflavus TaxID=67267 RepID=UPI000AB84F6F|nr:styrene monooxygenase/indole monooxygenase family protein [Streptomyces alboflavus]
MPGRGGRSGTEDEVRGIAIVGAGQAGLQLGLGLLAAGHQVTLVAERRPEEVRGGRVTSTQLMFGPALGIEREAGLALWDDTAPVMPGFELSHWEPDGQPDAPVRRFTAPFDDEVRSVDQRVKLAAWLELFEERGGRAEFRSVGPSEVAGLAAAHDLTVLATGRGELSALFAHDTSWPVHDRPQRTLACFYVHGVAHDAADPAAGHVRTTGVPPAGDVIIMRALTVGGPCDIVLFEGRWGGAYDCWGDRPDAAAGWRRALGLLRTHAPWEYERFRRAEPTDPGAALYGAITPTVRRPVAHVDGDRPVLGMADALAVHDPITGQGANNATRAAARYLDAILSRGELPFDEQWMRETFAAYWDNARHTHAFTEFMLREPQPEQVRRAIETAFDHPEVAHRFANGYADPSTYREWLMDPDGADAYLGRFTK